MTQIEHELLNPIGVSPKKWRFADTVVQCQHKFQNNSDKPPNRGFPVMMILQTMNIDKSRMVPIGNSSYAKNKLGFYRSGVEILNGLGPTYPMFHGLAAGYRTALPQNLVPLLGEQRLYAKEKCITSEPNTRKKNKSLISLPLSPLSLSLSLPIGLSKSSAQKCGIYLRKMFF